MKPLAYYVEGVAEGRRGVLVQRQKDRSVWRVVGDGRVWFAKRGLTPKRRREIRREAENARALAARDLGPPVLGSGLHEAAQWIVTEDAYSLGGLPLAFGLRQHGTRAEVQSVGESIRRIHDAGFEFPDLTTDHAWVTERGLWLIDAARLVRRRTAASVEARSRDLAALLFSAQRHAVKLSRTDRARLVHAATGARSDALRTVHRRVNAELERLRGRTRWRWEHWACTEHFRHSFARSRGMDPWNSSIGMDEILDRRNWLVIRTLPDRQNRRIPIESETFEYFAKYYPPRPGRASLALDELEAIDRFQRAGILVNVFGAHVEDRSMGSLVAVKAARGEPLDDLLRRGVSVAERRALAVETARIWRRMRECGLRHRDAYPCHVFVAPWTSFGVPPSGGSSTASRKANDPAEAGTPNEGKANDPPEAGTTNLRHELRLIDLTRAGTAPFPKERWFVKDAAALWHGLPKPPVTRTDAVRWLREYFRIARLDARAKRFARRVAAKEARIAARQKRKSTR